MFINNPNIYIILKIEIIKKDPTINRRVYPIEKNIIQINFLYLFLHNL